LRIVLSDVAWTPAMFEEMTKMNIVLASGMQTEEERLALFKGVNGEGLIKKEEHLNVLFSFFYARGGYATKGNQILQDIKAAKLKGKMYLDSGVFSARKKGMIIPTEELIDFYFEHEDTIDHVFSMDDGPIETQLKNAKQMKDAGLPVIGIFHPGTMPLDYLDKLNEICDYVSIGMFSVGGFMKKDSIINTLDKVWEYIYHRDLMPMKIHLLGTENTDVLIRYPFYSSDASSFFLGYANGAYSYFNKMNQRIKMINLRKNLTDAATLDINAVDLKGDSIEHRVLRASNSIRARFDLQRFVTDVWTKKGVVWED